MSQLGDQCCGKWLRGSGGHRIHTPCGRDATWTHPDDIYAYCDECILESDKPMYLHDTKEDDDGE